MSIESGQFDIFPEDQRSEIINLANQTNPGAMEYARQRLVHLSEHYLVQAIKEPEIKIPTIVRSAKAAGVIIAGLGLVNKDLVGFSIGASTYGTSRLSGEIIVNKQIFRHIRQATLRSSTLAGLASRLENQTESGEQ